MPGEHLVHAQQLVALEVNLEQEAILVTNHALEATPIPKTVMVSRKTISLCAYLNYFLRA